MNLAKAPAAHDAAGRLAAVRDRIDEAARVLLQVNLAEKESQFGFAADEVAAAAAELSKLNGLALEGLMCIAPEVEEQEQTRPYFRRLATLHKELAAQMREAGHPWQH